MKIEITFVVDADVDGRNELEMDTAATRAFWLALKRYPELREARLVSVMVANPIEPSRKPYCEFCQRPTQCAMADRCLALPPEEPV